MAGPRFGQKRWACSAGCFSGLQQERKLRPICLGFSVIACSIAAQWRTARDPRLGIDTESLLQAQAIATSETCPRAPGGLLTHPYQGSGPAAGRV